MRMTTGDHDVLKAIDRIAFLRGLYPTVREINAELCLASHSVITTRLERLQVMGMINRLPARARAIEITAEGRAYLDGLRQPSEQVELTDEGHLAAEAFRTLGEVALDNLRMLERRDG